MSHSRNNISENLKSAVVALSGAEVANRFGNANAEYIKGYTGNDNASGQEFAKSHLKIKKYNVSKNASEGVKNIKQQAGFSAEVAATSRDNAELIISKSKIRVARSDDLVEFGKNHPIVDRVQVIDGNVIDGTQSQMKFVGNRNRLLASIAKEDGRFSRYRGVKIELPSEQFEGATHYCSEQANKLRLNSERASSSGKFEVAQKLRREADNYDQLAKDIRDSGLTTEEAIFYREHPEVATALDIAKTSHGAGLEGARNAAILGGCISILTNFRQLVCDEKTLKTATIDLSLDLLKFSAVGYASVFAGSVLTGLMNQSEKEVIRRVAGTSAPVLMINACLSFGSSFGRYVDEEISGFELLKDFGEKSAGVFSSALAASIGQSILPLPVVGAFLGGIAGSVLSSMLYQATFVSERRLAASHDRLARVMEIRRVASERIAIERNLLERFVENEIPSLISATDEFFVLMLKTDLPIDSWCAVVNSHALLLGKCLRFNSKVEFDDFMVSDERLVL